MLATFITLCVIHCCCCFVIYRKSSWI